MSNEAPESIDESIVDRAIAWQQAVAAGEADWAALTLWLEADPRHAAAFDEAALLDDAVTRHRAAIAAILPRDEAAEPAPARRRTGWRWAAGGGVAAALAVAIAVPMLLPAPEAAPTVYASQPGRTRDVALADGSRITLSAASRISVGAHQRSIALDSGAAWFDVPHDPARQLTITAQGYRITDIGTRFSVDAEAGRVVVAVAQGQVTVDPPVGDTVTLAAGQRLSGTGGAAPVVSAVAAQSVGAWRTGRLVYNDAPLGMVAADISRYRGAPVVVDPALKGRRFSGVLVIGDGSTLVSDLAGVAGLRVERRGDAVVLRGSSMP
jgi:transmembrane sensor